MEAMLYTARCILLFPLLTFLLSAQSRPDFSGSWLMNNGADPATTTGSDTPYMKVTHHEPALTVVIAASSREQDPMVWRLTTDATENVNRMKGSEVRSKTHWQGDTLVTEWTTEAKGFKVQHRQMWTLSKDGKLLTMVMRDGDNEMKMTATKM